MKNHQIAMLIFVITIIFALPKVGYTVEFQQSSKIIKIKKHCSMELFTKKEILNVAIGDEKIADIIILGPRHIRLVGKDEGLTNLTITYKDKRLYEYRVVVDKGLRVEVLIGIITSPRLSLKGW